MIPMSIVIAASSVVTTLTLVAVFAAGWWTARRRTAVDDPSTAGRIGLADLRARMRRLEAIASGIDCDCAPR